MYTGDRLMMTSSTGNIFRVTGPLCGEFTGDRWIALTKASDAELWCFLWSAWIYKAGDLRRHRAHYDVTVMWRRDRLKGTLPYLTPVYTSASDINNRVPFQCKDCLSMYGNSYYKDKTVVAAALDESSPTLTRYSCLTRTLSLNIYIISMNIRALKKT